MIVVAGDEVVELVLQISTSMIRMKPQTGYFLPGMPDCLSNGATFITRGCLAQLATLLFKLSIDLIQLLFGTCTHSVNDLSRFLFRLAYGGLNEPLPGFAL